MLTSEERKNKFMKISELSGDNEEVMNLLEEIQADDTERTSNEPTYSDSDVMDTDGVRWDKKYADMQTKYRERFFSGNSEPDEETKEKETTTPNDITFDDLFE